MVDIAQFHSHSLGGFEMLGEDASSASLSVGSMRYKVSFHTLWALLTCFPLDLAPKRTDDLRWRSDTLCRRSWSLTAEFPSRASEPAPLALGEQGGCYHSVRCSDS